MTGHYDEITLQEYLDDPGTFAGRSELEAHIAACASCRALLDELRAFELTLSSDAMWEIVGGAPATSEPPMAVRELAMRLSSEDADAERLLTPLLTSPLSFRRANVTSNVAMRTAGVVRMLCEESRALREKQPMHALVLADAAIAIADQLSTKKYPTPFLDELRGDGWLERANVLRYLGRYPEAVDALDVASRAFSRSPVAVYSGALVDYMRAVVFMEMERLDEARRLARKSARVFRQFGENERFVHARLCEGSVLFYQSRFREARELFLPLVPLAKNIGKPENLACIFANIANCEVQMRMFESAEGYFARALSLYEALGMESGKIRTRWNIGSLRVAAGDIDDGLARLREAQRGFQSLGAHTDAALVTLEIVETLLARGEKRDLREASELCSGLVESFSAVGMTGNALTALAYLRETFEAGQATPDLVRHVRHYIETRPGPDGNPFVPPRGI